MAVVCHGAVTTLVLLANQDFHMSHFGETSASGISAILVRGSLGYHGVILGIVGVGRVTIVEAGVVIPRKITNPTLDQLRMAS
jgi:hypothetical protein